MAGIDGSFALLKIGQKYVGGQLGGSLDETVDVEDITHKFSPDRSKEFLGTEISASGSIECMVDPNDSTNATYTEVKTTMRAREAVDFTFGEMINGATLEKGKLIITGISKAIPKAGKITFTLNFQVTGPISTEVYSS